MTDPINLLLLAIVLAFSAWEVVAAFVDRRERGGRLVTLSEYVWAFQRRFGLPAKLLSAAACLMLLIHFVWELP